MIPMPKKATIKDYEWRMGAVKSVCFYLLRQLSWRFVSDSNATISDLRVWVKGDEITIKVKAKK